MAEVFSTALGRTLPADQVDADRFVIRHDVLEKEIVNGGNQQFVYSYKAIHISPTHNVVECTMTNVPLGKTVTKVGESVNRTLTSEIARDYAATMAYQRAFDRASIVILGLEAKKVFSDNEVSLTQLLRERGYNTSPIAPDINNDRKAEEAEYVSDIDDMVLLFGNCKGKKYKEVKGTDQFRYFVSWLLENKVAKFPDAERQCQLDMLRGLAEQGLL